MTDQDHISPDAAPSDNELGRICGVCDAVATEDAKWCEACGHDLNAKALAVCTACDEPQVGADGYCQICGHKAPSERDHSEATDGPLAAVTDRGKRHSANEDAFGIGHFAAGEQSTIVAMIVCDGVSSTPGSAEVSLAAATAARVRLLDGLAEVAGQSLPDQSQREALLIEAAEVAQAEAVKLGAVADASVESNDLGGPGPPSSTFVAVLGYCSEETVQVSVAWLGDSRAYWITADRAQQLTEDHELQNALTRWIGADSFSPIPDVAHFEFEAGGQLVVCSDGLWRYMSDDHGLPAAELFASLDTEDGPDRQLALAQRLVEFANEQGGHDNITVALWSPSAPVETIDNAETEADHGSGESQTT